MNSVTHGGHLTIRINPALWQRVKEAATAKGCNASTWLRQVIVEALKDEASDG